MMDLSSEIARSPEVMSAPVDREIVFLHPTADSYVALDEIGRRIWDLLEHPRRIAELVAILSEEYAAPPGSIERDVVTLVQELADDGILRVKDADRA